MGAPLPRLLPVPRTTDAEEVSHQDSGWGRLPAPLCAASSVSSTEGVRRASAHAAMRAVCRSRFAGVHDTQIRRYEAATSAPTLDVLRNLAIALQISADSLVFAVEERGPDENLRLAFEATNELDPDEQAMVRQLIEAVLLKHQAKRWAS